MSSNLPSGQTVGIVDPKLLQVVKEEVGCKVQGGEVVQEICRGVRLHMNKFVKALEEKKENMAQLGLGHSYSRSKVKFNVNRSDNMVIQAIALIDQLDKARIRYFSIIFRPFTVGSLFECRMFVKDSSHVLAYAWKPNFTIRKHAKKAPS